MINSIQIDDKEFVIIGKLIKKIRLNDEWIADIENPDSIIKKLQAEMHRPDIFTFMQRLPETTPKYNYYIEWENIAAIPLNGFDYWWGKKISSDSRNKVRKAPKRGVDVRVAKFNDELVKGIMNIFNEMPIKRGKSFRHYGKDFDTVKKELADALDSSEFIGAYYQNELIGFIKLNYTDRYAMITMILSLMKHFNKFPNNALIAKAVEICAERKVPYITYTTWRSGTHGDFQRLNGFEKFPVPRYYVPLTLRGKIILKLKLHHGIKGMLPEWVIGRLLDLRTKWYERKLVGK
ncbi:MAG: hypothetical protein HY755_06210 [Nitrospirae bacterium]|nr:hypothetical protein [Nitrospirota bacterium]